MTDQLLPQKPAPAVRVLRRSERVRCVACGHKHVTTARLPWCALSATAASQRPVSDASSQRSEGASQGK